MMIRNFKFSFLLLLTISFINCGGDDDVIETQTRTADDVRTDFQALQILPGVNDLQLESTEKGFFWNFRVISPATSSPNNKRPLVITLHGASGGSTTAHKNTECLVEPGLASLNAFIISPNAGTGEWYDQANQLQIVALVDLAKTYWDVDSSKVLVTGYSNGGNGSWFFADFYPEIFSASIPIASSYNPKRTDESLTEIEVPMYVIHGENDELFPVNETQNFVEQSVNAGSSIKFVIAPGLTHYKPCEYVSHLQDAAEWVKTEIWN
jgi:predicted peptidase